jgi:hypothetical protein
MIKPRPGFDWRRVTWGRPDSVRSALCSYCSAAIGEGEVPLIMWNQESYAAQFCEACMVRWFGFEPRADGGDAADAPEG